MDEEKAWVKQVLAGDQAAFARLVDAYKVPIYNLAYRLLGDAVEAEEAAQETFVRVYTRLSTYDPDRKLSSWILSIASHYCIDRLRRKRVAQLPIEDLLAQQAFSDPHDGPEKAALHREEEEIIRTLLAGLPEQYRLVIALRYWQDLSYQEMAGVLNTTESAIKSRLHRARCLLAERIRVLEDRVGTSSGRESPSSLSVSDERKKVVQNALFTSH